MELSLSPEKTIEYISQPAFLVKNGYITDTNEAAAKLQLKTGISANELITVGGDEYAAFESGRLYLSLTVGRAWVSICEGAHLFCVEDPYSTPELRALALAAQHLRQPLSNVMCGIDTLKQNKAFVDNEEIKEQVGSINRSIHALLRAICNMSDAAPADINSKANLQLQNAASVFLEIFEKMSEHTAQCGRTLKHNTLKNPLECAIDAPLMERALLNILSNAIKFSPDGSTITATVKQTNRHISVTVENTISKDYLSAYTNFFQKYRRTPGIEDRLTGIGLGMSIVSGVMQVHAGTVLIDTVKKDRARIALTFPVRTDTSAFHSPVQLIGGYTGGIDSYLVELADILPSHFYE